jgi:hypothetical protein
MIPINTHCIHRVLPPPTNRDEFVHLLTVLHPQAERALSHATSCNNSPPSTGEMAAAGRQRGSNLMIRPVGVDKFKSIRPGVEVPDVYTDAGAQTANLGLTHRSAPFASKLVSRLRPAAVVPDRIGRTGQFIDHQQEVGTVARSKNETSHKHRYQLFVRAVPPLGLGMF